MSNPFDLDALRVNGYEHVNGATLAETLTFGEWDNEADSVAAFDEVVAATGLFKVYPEVRGVYLQPRLGPPPAAARIDRVLSPTQKLLELGWEHGPIGVECKASGLKCGPPLSQMLDYSRAIWRLPHGYQVALSWIFLWPLHKQHGTVASIMAQNRIGSAEQSNWEALRLHSGEANILRIKRDGEVLLGAARNGLRVGSRSGSRA